MVKMKPVQTTLLIALGTTDVPGTEPGRAVWPTLAAFPGPREAPGAEAPRTRGEPGSVPPPSGREAGGGPLPAVTWGL